MSWGGPATHSEVLTAKYEELLLKSGFNPKDLTDILVSHGPGSFTGLRVGLNFAKSLGYSYDLPIHLSSSFRGILDFKTLLKHRNLILIRPALQHRFYVAQYFLDTFDKIVEKVLPQTLTTSQIEKTFESVESLNIQTPYTPALPLLWSESFLEKANFVSYPESFKYCTNHLHLFQNHYDSLIFEKSNWKSAYPLYIRASEAEEKMKTGDLKIHKKRIL